MRIHYKISLILLLSVGEVFSSLIIENENADKSFKSIPTIEELEKEEFENHKLWLNNYAASFNYDTDAAAAHINTSLNKLSLDEKPLPYNSCVYIQNTETDKVSLKKNTTINDNSLSIKLFVDNNGNQTNYLSFSKVHNETFAYTQKKTHKGKRKHPPTYDFILITKTGNVSFDLRHGIDHADTLLSTKNSSHDPRNYTPQNSYYNQNIRRPLARAIRNNNGTYKEIAVYNEKPLLTNGNIPIPIGFIFVEFYNHSKSKTYYFPNLINYRSYTESKEKSAYKLFCNNFEIDDQGAFTATAIKSGNIDSHIRTVNYHSNIGYRTLSGRIEIADDSYENYIPKAARAALSRMTAIYNLERAAELEFNGVEEKCSVVNTFTSKMKYYALDSLSPEEDATRTKEYFLSYNKKSQELGIDMLDYALDFRRIISPSKDDQLEEGLQAIYKENEKFEKGQSLYDPVRAKYWLNRIEVQLKNKKTIEDTIRLLELYDIPELQKDNRLKELQMDLNSQGKKSTIEEKRQIAQYFHDHDDLKQAKYWLDSIEEHLHKKSTLEERAAAADWYSRGRGVIPSNPFKAKVLYEELLNSDWVKIHPGERGRLNYLLKEVSKSS